MDENHRTGWRLIFDAGGGAGPAPTGPLFGSTEWKEPFVHMVKEAAHLGLELSLRPQSGWNLGGPDVRPEESGKVMAWSKMSVTGPREHNELLPVPAAKPFHYTVLLAYRSKPGKSTPIRQLREKALFKELGGSAENCRPLLVCRVVNSYS